MKEIKKVLTVCPYCASGCKLYLHVDGDKVVGAEGANGHTNQGELCLKGYYGWDFINDTKILTPRLTTPMLRRNRDEPLQPATWEEAISFAAENLAKVKETHGSDSIYLTGSSRGSGNEVNYLMQKFARAVVGTNNVDCCARV